MGPRGIGLALFLLGAALPFAWPISQFSPGLAAPLPTQRDATRQASDVRLFVAVPEGLVIVDVYVTIDRRSLAAARSSQIRQILSRARIEGSTWAEAKKNWEL